MRTPGVVRAMACRASELALGWFWNFEDPPMGHPHRGSLWMRAGHPEIDHLGPYLGPLARILSGNRLSQHALVPFQALKLGENVLSLVCG